MSLAYQIPDRTAWLAERRTGIGASEAAAALGLSPFATPLDVFLEKTGQGRDREPTEAMRIGLALEPAVARLYTEETGRELAESQVFMRDDARPHILATLDGIADDGRVVELKTSSGFMADQWTDDPDGIPTHYYLQVQQQMYVAHKDNADVAVLIGGSKFRVYTIPRNEGVIASMLDKLDAFWASVVARIAPDPTFRDLEALSKLAPHLVDTIELSDPSDQLNLDRYNGLGDLLKSSGRLRDEVKVALITAMQGHARAVFPDGSVVARKQITRKAYEVKESTFVEFRVKAAKGGDS